MKPNSEINVIKPELPKGGTTIKGMGEQFTPHEFSGAASLSIPLPITPCRGIQPNLNLQYSSGNANSAFGMGWDLSLSSISRQTSKGTPRYDGTDTFLLSGDDYLVKDLKFKTCIEKLNGESYKVQRYKPRVEGNYSLIDYYINKDTSKSDDRFWKVRTAGNTVYIYGKSASARIFDPKKSSHIFKWLPEEVYDDKGNHRIYEYTKENDKNLTKGQKESNRDYQTNVYLNKIKYGNDKAITDGSLILGESKSELGKVIWHFELVFDYGQYNTDTSNADPYDQLNPKGWAVRKDPFSTYDAGFEIRTWRLCQKVLMFHRFKELNKSIPVLTDILRLSHNETPYFSFLTSVRLTGSSINKKGAYEQKSMPQIDLGYTPFLPISDQNYTHDFDLLTRDMVWDYQFVDLYSEGIPGLLLADGEQVFYHEAVEGKDGQPAYSSNEAIPFPPQRTTQGMHTLADVTGNGKLDLLITEASQSGYFEMQSNQQWDSFKNFQSFPDNYHNPYITQADLTGDGLADLVMIDDKDVLYNASERDKGYAPQKSIPRSEDNAVTESHLPSQKALSTFSDFLGAGSAQRVKITQKEVICWPGLGYGKFGKAVIMANTPDFGPDFDVNRLHLADIDGSGLTDLAYVYPNHISIWLNQSGNGFSGPINIPFPKSQSWTPLDKIQFADVKGNGTSCLVFTKMTPSPQQWYYDFNKPLQENESSQKPHLLNSIVNNLGASTTINYCSSTKFYLADKAKGIPWITKAPFPVNVIESVVSRDEISGTRLNSAYQYRHGYYDGYEREFRGFGFVGRTDSPSFDFKSEEEQTSDSSAYNQAPLHTKTWYHTGAMIKGETLLEAYKKEFWNEGDQFNLPNTFFKTLGGFLYKSDIRGAHRALHGTVLRTEVYGNDHTPWSETPYTVSEAQFKVTQLQRKGSNKYSVFRIHQMQSISWDYERNADDPMVSHNFTLKTDEYGHVLESATVHYGRKKTDPGFCEQTNDQQGKLWVSYHLNKLNNPGVFKPDNNGTEAYLLGVPIENQSFEIKGLKPDQGNYFSFSGIAGQISNAMGKTTGHELLDWERHYYFDAQNQKELKLNSIAIPLLHHRSEHIAFELSGLSKIKGLPQNYPELLTGNGATTEGAKGGYITFNSNDFESDYYWNPGASQQYSNEDMFYLPMAYLDPFQYQSVYYGSKAEWEKDPHTSYIYDPYCLMIEKVEDAMGNSSVLSDFDYVQMHAKTMTDANNNWSKIFTDSLGMVIATAHGGTQGTETVGFDLDSYAPVSNPTVDDIIKSPAKYLQKAASFFYYDLDSWKDKQFPAHSVHLNYTAYTEINDQPITKNLIQKSIAYSDGFGRLLQSKAFCDQPQKDIANQPLKTSWLTSGATIYNNKGNPIKQYEPFFSPDYNFSQTEAKQQIGYASTLFYDALNRNVLVKSAEGFFTKTLFGKLKTAKKPDIFNDYLNDKLYGELSKQSFDLNGPSVKDPQTYIFEPSPWSTLHYDANDCSNITEFKPTDKTDVDTASFKKAKAFANTPHINIIGSIGKTVESRQLNVTETEQDINYATFDILGNDLTQTDQRLMANGYHNFQTTYNLGTAIETVSADAGKSWVFANVAGDPIYHKDERGFEQYKLYDVLLRPTEVKVFGGDLQEGALKNTVKKMVYCDTNGSIIFKDAQKANLIGKAVIAFDESGMHLAPAYSIMGAALTSRQWIKSDYENEADWSKITSNDIQSLASSLKDVYSFEELAKLVLPDNLEKSMLKDVFVTASTHNAIGQLLTATDADGNIQSPSYDSLGHEIALTITAGQNAKKSGAKTTPGTTNIEYNAKGQQIKEVCSNGITTTHKYDPENFRLIQISSKRNSDGKILQDLNYHHDPVGNVCSVTNKAVKTIFFNNNEVEARADYTFDSLYQLKKAIGREQAGMWDNVQNNQGKDDYRFYQKYKGQKNNGQALQNYTQTYSYDAGGNLLSQQNKNTGKRITTICPDSNRIASSGFGKKTPSKYDYDVHGNMLTLEGTAGIQWNFRDNMSASMQVKRKDGNNDAEYYVYDGSGQRVRKISRQKTDNGWAINEVLYAGGIEIRRTGSQSSNNAISYSKVWHNVKLMQGRAVSCMWRYWISGEVKKDTAKSQQRFQLCDFLDSSNYEVDENAQMITYEEYYPYGGTSIMAGTSITEVKDKHYRYSGKEQDKTGLYYYGMRYYAPWLGRWTSTDPAGTVDGLNIYAFVGGNPVTGVDVMGNAFLCKTCNIGFKNDKEYMQHLKNEHPVKYQNKRQKKVAFKKASPNAKWTGDNTKPMQNMLVSQWNTQGGNIDKIHSTFEYEASNKIPDVLVIQEAPPINKFVNNAKPEKEPLFQGSFTVNKKQRGINETIEERVNFVHLSTGSKNLAILSKHPIQNPHAIKLNDSARPALAAEIEGNKIVDIHLPSGQRPFAQSILTSSINKISDDKTKVTLMGDFNIDPPEVKESLKKVEKTSFIYHKPTQKTQKSGGKLDHAIEIKPAKVKNTTIKEEEITILAQKSDHNRLQMHLNKKK